MRAEGSALTSRLSRLTIVTILAAALLPAAPPLSSIRDVLYRADGALFNGTADISWKSFLASDSSYIAQNRMTVRIVNGQLNLKLVPTTTASAGAYYTVQYNTDGRIMYSETWSVPVKTGYLKIPEVRVATVNNSGGTTPDPSAPITISDITGLSDALEMRPLKGLLYQTGKVAFIDETGAIGTVIGDPGDCVRVDGTAGPCGTGGSGSSNITFVDLEIPSGTINGNNADFTLTSTPLPAASLHFFRNGVLQRNGTDYTLSGAVVTFVAGAIPQPGDILLASYRITQ
jgi:hypothetical protein